MFTSRAATHLVGLPYDIVAYHGITLVDPKAGGSLFIHRDGMVSRFFMRVGYPYVPPLFPSFSNQIVSLLADAAKACDRLALFRPTIALHGLMSKRRSL